MMCIVARSYQKKGLAQMYCSSHLPSSVIRARVNWLFTVRYMNISLLWQLHCHLLNECPLAAWDVYRIV